MKIKIKGKIETKFNYTHEVDLEVEIKNDDIITLLQIAYNIFTNKYGKSSLFE